MREIDRIGDQMGRAVEGKAWYGLSIATILDGIDTAGATARPFADAHTIWEILNHMTAWTRIVVKRLTGERIDPTDEQDWPPVRDVNEAAWQAAKDDFRGAQQEVQSKLKSMSNDELGMPVVGCDYNVCFMLHGLVQHHVYHAGQISLLKKAVGTRSTAADE